MIYEWRLIDAEKLARKILFIQRLVEELNPQTIEDKLILSIALETNAKELRHQVTLITRQSQNPSS